MSKKRTPRGKPPAKKLRRGMTKTAVIAMAIILVATVTAVSRFEPLRRALRLSAATTPAQAPGNPTLAKEYISANGRLIATEEPTPAAATPTPTPSGTTPMNLTATVKNAPSISIDLTWDWTAPATGTVSHFVVERVGRSGVTTLIAPQNGSPFTDSTAQADNVYRYRVQVVFSGGGASDFSNGDLATTFFQGDSIVAGQTVIRAKHFTDLRQAVNDVRQIAGLATASWSTPAPAIGGNIMGNHMAELRTNLEPALAALGLPPTTYPDAAPLGGKDIRAAHINELRARVR